ncbi:MAG TPA: hypothetical protein VN282_24895 [Pyrinomonadaceae bacterium]|nr:hypothetical protein [Pyrinomonadaceae bacterium]
MEQEEPRAALYDFLYRDSSRIASYYAQLFSGRLTSLEELESSRDASEKHGEANVQLLKGGTKKSADDSFSQKRVIDPHDVITTDVLSYLVEHHMISEDVEAAEQGSLFIAQGSLVFCDKFMLETAVLAFEAAAAKPKTSEERQNAAGIKMLKQFLSRVTFPSAYLLHTQVGEMIAGTIKDEGMEEPISTYYFRHGTAGLPGVYMIGIKEMSSESFQLPQTQFIGASQFSAQFLSNMVFPEGSLKATPLAFFRKL